MFNKENYTIQELQEQFDVDCTILNPQFEYPGYIGEERFFIVTSLSENELKSKYKTIIVQYEPYLILDKSFVDVKEEFEKNAHKHKMRAHRTEDIYGYIDGETEIYHKELVTDTLFDDVIKSIEISEIYEAVEQLSKTQRERFIMHYRYGISSRKIADIQHINHSAVNKSLIIAIEQVRRTLGVK